MAMKAGISVLLLYIIQCTGAMSHSSASSDPLSDSDIGLRKMMGGATPLGNQKKEDFSSRGNDSASQNIDEIQRRRQRNVGYARKYRMLHPQKARDAVRRYKENVKKDPIRRERRRLQMQKYNADFKQRQKVIKALEQAKLNTGETRREDVPQGKRKAKNPEGESSAKRPRILHYGRPPMSSAFIRSEAERSAMQAARNDEASSQEPRRILRIKLPKQDAKPSSSKKE
ncbi:uncharacterized protein FA14DRAFT_160050 [Meira miltonrushii]|uniref:Uncharacterized protein n=1 Tax=Meira miltonrushii TaxID=1280837 RepID=A0A316VLW3_9BASI|nr:uncharacterized protein FA14DRAFT_160050 [Meira miltonrushii]PWN38582.1 hypothetical protein FA14DRAFT_160050 [Meira miltonrushii]